MSDESETCPVCKRPLLPDEARASNGRDPVHAACDRRTRWRLKGGATCPVCTRPIHSVDGVARLGSVLVHGVCYVRARTPGQNPPLPEPPSAPASRVGGLARRLAFRFLRRFAAQQTE